MKRFKNNKQTADTWCGMTIEPGAYYVIEAIELSRWQNNSKVLSDIGSGDGIMNDGSSDILDVAAAIGFLKDEDPTQRDADGAILSRVKVTETGWNFQMLSFKITTAKSSGGIRCKDDIGNDLNYFTYKMYDANGDETQTDANAVKTVVDFEPPFDYEIMGGQMLQAAVPGSSVYFHVIGVPDVPAQYGGSKKFIVDVDLAFVANGRPFTSDGRAPKKLIYSATNHTNKLRFIFSHDVGVQHTVMQVMEYFRP